MDARFEGESARWPEEWILEQRRETHNFSPAKLFAMKLSLGPKEKNEVAPPGGPLMLGLCARV